MRDALEFRHWRQERGQPSCQIWPHSNCNFEQDKVCTSIKGFKSAFSDGRAIFGRHQEGECRQEQQGQRAREEDGKHLFEEQEIEALLAEDEDVGEQQKPQVTPDPLLKLQEELQELREQLDQERHRHERRGGQRAQYRPQFDQEDTFNRHKIVNGYSGYHNHH